MKLKKFFLLAVLLLSPIFSSTIVSAQTTVINLNVSDVQFDKSSYSAGEEIKGSFTLSNEDSMDHNDLTLTHALIRINPDTGVIEDNYGLVSTGSLFVSAQSKKTIPISFSIPTSGKSDNLSFVISITRPNGSTIVFHHQPLQVTGFISSVSFGNSFVSANGKEYDLQEGPIVKDFAPTLEVNVLNSSSEALTLTPVVKVKMLSTENPVIADKSYDVFTVPANGELKLSLPLPFLEKAGVYLAELALLDSQNRSRATSLFARYITAGDIATISSINVDKNQVEKNEVINIKVAYTGGPVDIETGKAASSGNATLSLTLKNEKGQVIGEESSEVNLDTLGATKDFTFTSSKKAEGIFAEAVIIKEGVELARYSVGVTDPSFYEKGTSLPTNTTLLVLLLAGLVAIGLIVLTIFKKIKNQTTMVVFLFVVGITLLSFSTGASAATYSNTAASRYVYTASTFLNKTTYAPGESVAAQIQGVSLAAAVCTNNPRNVTNTYSLQGNSTVTQSWGDSSGLNNHSKSSWSSGTIAYPSISTNPINAPAIPGTYNLTVNVTLDTRFAFPGGPYGNQYAAGPVIPFSELPLNECIAAGSFARARPPFNGGQVGCWCPDAANGCTGTDKIVTIPIVIPITVVAPPSNASCGVTNNSCTTGTLSDTADSSTQYLWSCNGSNGGTNASCSLNIPTSSCGTANTVASFGFPSSGLCATSNTASSQVTSTTGAPHTWACTRTGSPAVSCQAPRCSTGNTYCSTSNSCILNSASCGPTSGSCTFTGNGINYSLNPSIVDTPQDTCALSWNVSSANNNTSSGAVCSPAVTCRLNNIATTVSGSQSLTPGTYTLSCTDSLNTIINRTFQCKVNPNYGEF